MSTLPEIEARRKDRSNRDRGRTFSHHDTPYIEAVEDVAILLAAFKKYGGHKSGCAAYYGDDCDCDYNKFIGNTS